MDVSCSDCKLEVVERRWTQLLLKWINTCVSCDIVNDLNPKSLADIITRYNKDIITDDFERAILCTDDVEPFIKYKYPMLRLRFLAEESDIPKRLYITASVILYHCCMCTQSGAVDQDICRELTKYEQEVILKFCENLNQMETTINNVQCAIKDAFESFENIDDEASTSDTFDEVSSDTIAQASTTTIISVTPLPSDETLIPDVTTSKYNTSTVQFVLPTVITESTYPDEVTESDDQIMNEKDYDDSNETLQTEGSETVNTYLEEITQSNEANQNQMNKKYATSSPKFFEKKDDSSQRLESPMTSKKFRQIVENRNNQQENKNEYVYSFQKCGQKKKTDSLIHFWEMKEKEKILKNKIQNQHALRILSDNDDELETDIQTNTLKKSHQDRKKDFRQKKEIFTISKRQKMEKDEINQNGIPADCKKTRNCDSYYESIFTNSFELVKTFDQQKDIDANNDDNPPESNEINHRCLAECSCIRCSSSGPCCGDPGSTMGVCEQDEKKIFGKVSICCKRKCAVYVVIILLIVIILVMVCAMVPLLSTKNTIKLKVTQLQSPEQDKATESDIWECKDGLCHKAYKSAQSALSYSQCCLLCTGPQLWPHPTGYTSFSRKIVKLASTTLAYKLHTMPSEAVQEYLSETLKLFITNLARLENSVKSKSKNENVKKMLLEIAVETDSEPRLKLNTEEAYHLSIKTIDDQVNVKISSASFCGARHGLETLSQLILLDESSSTLITLSSAVVRDGPTHKYRGLMVDTARNYIPVADLMRTVDAMASVKLNTFHWRISDVTSFPLLIPKLPQLFENGGYDRSMVYTEEDVKTVVDRAGLLGVRVLMEVATPGPVGRPWSWSPDVSCPMKNNNSACNNALCLRLGMKDSVFDILQVIYEQILDMTKEDDIFHLSDGVFSLANCFFLTEDREGFLNKALHRLRLANKGFMPKLPVVWYTGHLKKYYEAKTWERMGVQMNEVRGDDESDLSRFKVIHSSKWDLSCEMKNGRCWKYRTWQEMYSWNSWRNIQVFTIEGGEALLWTDLVNSGNLDFHLWPRAAVVAERLWSDVVVNVTATKHVYIRLDRHRQRMLHRGINVQLIWPAWCSYNPGDCLRKLQT